MACHFSWIIVGFHCKLGEVWRLLMTRQINIKEAEYLFVYTGAIHRRKIVRFSCGESAREWILTT